MERRVDEEGRKGKRGNQSVKEMYICASQGGVDSQWAASQLMTDEMLN